MSKTPTHKPGTMTQEVTYGPLDVAEAEVVEIEVSESGKTVWINVDGICAFRATRIKHLSLNDNRKNENNEAGTRELPGAQETPDKD